MRIAFITTEYPPEFVGGLGTYSKAVSEELAKMGNEVTVITASTRDGSEGRNPKVIRVGSGIYGYATDDLFFKKSLPLIPEADIYICNDVHTAKIGLWLKSRGKKVVFILHRSSSIDSAILGELERKMIREADLSIAVSRIMKERYGCDISIPNGCDCSHPDLGREHVLVVSRNSPEKRLDKLSRFHDYPYPIYVIGKGTESIRFGNVIGLGFVDEEKKNELFSKARFLLHPADFEPFGIVILEMAYSGKPVVLLGEAGAEEVVDVLKGEEWVWRLADDRELEKHLPTPRIRKWRDVAKDLMDAISSI